MTALVENSLDRLGGAFCNSSNIMHAAVGRQKCGPLNRNKPVNPYSLQTYASTVELNTSKLVRILLQSSWIDNSEVFTPLSGNITVEGDTSNIKHDTLLYSM